MKTKAPCSKIIQDSTRQRQGIKSSLHAHGADFACVSGGGSASYGESGQSEVWNTGLCPLQGSLSLEMGSIPGPTTSIESNCTLPAINKVG